MLLVSGAREVKDGWMMRVARRAIWEGGGIRAGVGLSFELGKCGGWRAVVVVPSARRPERMWIAAVSVWDGISGVGAGLERDGYGTDRVVLPGGFGSATSARGAAALRRGMSAPLVEGRRRGC